MPDEQQRRRRRRRRWRRRRCRDSRTRAGVAVEQRDAVEEERRGERAEQEVLERRLLREQPAAAGQPAQQVQRQRQHLERDEHRQQVVRGREEQHAADREQRQREDLGLHATRRRWRRARPRRRASRRPAATNAPPVASSERSAMSSTPTIASTRMVPCRNSAGPSTATAPCGDDLRCAPSAACSDDRDERARPGRRAASTSCTRAAAGARHERLDEHADARAAPKHDQHRRERAVLDRRRRGSPRSRRPGTRLTAWLPSAAGDGTAAPGRCWPTWLHACASTAGLMTSSTGFG